jgi:hypothetical protein
MDSILDELLELRASAGHAIVEARINAEIHRCRMLLELPADEARTNFHRGQIAGLRTALNIPQILEDEAKQQLKAE